MTNEAGKNQTEVFRVTEPDGRTYRLFADGKIRGFAPGAVVFNRIPNLFYGSVSQASACPTSKEASSREGILPSAAAHFARPTEKMSAAAGEKK